MIHIYTLSPQSLETSQRPTPLPCTTPPTPPAEPKRPKKHGKCKLKLCDPASLHSQADDTLSDPIWKGSNVPEM